MFNNLKKKLYFSRIEILFEKGILNGDIVPFDNLFYKQMSDTYISCIPVSMHIKYLRPITRPGKCYERSLYMFLCFDDAVLVRGDTKNLELKYGKEEAGHGWIEIGDYVYDPTLLLKFKKEVYYEIYSPKNISKCTKEQYIKENKEFYEDIKNTTLKDFLPGGKKRTDLAVIVPLLKGNAEYSDDEEFKKEVTYYLSSIEYDEKQINEEIDTLLNTISEKVFDKKKK